MLQLLFRIFLILAFAVWFGGFTFYTAVVVPIGTDVLGSARTQGFVTQQVTNVLNIIGCVSVLLMLVDLFLNWKPRTPKVNLLLAIVLGVIVVLLGVLFVVHPILDSMLEPEHEHVNDDARFYEMHRIYLWASTIQWLLCLVWLVVIVRDWQNRAGLAKAC